MQPHSLVVIVTCLALLTYVWMGLRVAGSRRATGVQAPQMTGHPVLERHIRVQSNTLEWLPVFLTVMWLFAITWNDLFAAAAGLVWIAGRIVYALGYVRDPSKRELGFVVQLAVCAVLLFGVLGRAVWTLLQLGA